MLGAVNSVVSTTGRSLGNASSFKDVENGQLLGKLKIYDIYGTDDSGPNSNMVGGGKASKRWGQPAIKQGTKKTLVMLPAWSAN